jgi:hypothetical protein
MLDISMPEVYLKPMTWLHSCLQVPGCSYSDRLPSSSQMFASEVRFKNRTLWILNLYTD